MANQARRIHRYIYRSRYRDRDMDMENREGKGIWKLVASNNNYKYQKQNKKKICKPLKSVYNVRI